VIGRRFRLNAAAMTLAGVMMLCAKYSVYHLAWIADGVHIAQGLLFALAALAVLYWIESNAIAWCYISLACFAASVLLREDSLAIAPVLLAMAIVYSGSVDRWTAQKPRVTRFAGAVIVLSIAILFARQAVTVETDGSWTAARFLAAHPLEVITLAGWHPLILIPAFVAIFLFLLAAMQQFDPADARMAWFWLFCAVVSMTPAIVASRVNLLFFPMTFYCLFVAHVLTRFAIGDRQYVDPWRGAIAVTVALCCVALPAYQSRRQQLSMAPGSTGRLDVNCSIARGGEWAAITPRDRREQALAELQRLGLNATACAELFDSSGAVRGDFRLPDGVFVPPQRFLSR
jgi:hypothetical protein